MLGVNARQFFQQLNGQACFWHNEYHVLGIISAKMRAHP